jgi:hypothetical protein
MFVYYGLDAITISASAIFLEMFSLFDALVEYFLHLIPRLLRWSPTFQFPRNMAGTIDTISRFVGPGDAWVTSID